MPRDDFLEVELGGYEHLARITVERGVWGEDRDANDVANITADFLTNGLKR